MPSTELGFDASSTTADAIQRAAYRFSDRLALELHDIDGQIRCVLHSTEPLDDATLQAFRVEVLDQVLRARIGAETADVRNLILSTAFAPLVDPA